MLIDTHAHVNFNAYKNDAGEVIQRSLDNDIWLINVGSQKDTSKRAKEIAEKYSQGVYAAVALHPIHLFPIMIDEQEACPEGGERSEPSRRVKFQSREEEFDLEYYRNLALRPKVVAIGETGLEYYRINKINRPIAEIKEKQKAVFIQHLQLAREFNLPVIIHCRDAHKEILKILNSEQGRGGRGVVHCYSGTIEQAKQYLEMGFYISFTGVITFTEQYDAIIAALPLERLLVETDCPYLTPVPHRGKRNEPLYVQYVAEKICQIKNIPLNQIAEQTTKNALSLFNKISGGV